ncbi:hypothetical protein ABZ934_11715 [Streptomyces sp. NPDC046557]|uniref:hypothetical protein n=1 Tax=Streptomyces sp. NPDC046557 TaxID=3155372 RepID=UPI0033C7725F
MSAHENSPNSKAASPGSRADGSAATKRRTPGPEATGTGTGAHVGTDAPTALPAPLAEKTRAAAMALRGAVGPTGWLWTAVRARKGVTAGAATGTAALAAACYAAGRRAGLRRRGPLSRLTGGRP